MSRMRNVRPSANFRGIGILRASIYNPFVPISFDPRELRDLSLKALPFRRDSFFFLFSRRNELYEILRFT